jgi:hypothetical protein
VLEALRLWVKDIDLGRREVIVRSGKGNKYRVTVLPENVIFPFQEHLVWIKAVHDKDLDEGYGR